MKKVRKKNRKVKLRKDIAEGEDVEN